ncbi:hypothetical protein, partial [Methylobacterium frigidaeris]|uniref:hypothetical protein n=1 Tax=Methylobacterium frigidaeris TaxID=2038277 RepID=UPI001EDDC8BB
MKLSEDPSVSEITGALRALLTQEVERKRLSRGAITLIRDTHSPRRVGELYWQAIETFSSAGTVARCHQMMSMAVQDRNFAQATAADIANVSKCIDLNLPLRRAGAL